MILGDYSHDAQRGRVCIFNNVASAGFTDGNNADRIITGEAAGDDFRFEIGVF